VNGRPLLGLQPIQKRCAASATPPTRRTLRQRVKVPHRRGGDLREGAQQLCLFGEDVAQRPEDRHWGGYSVRVHKPSCEESTPAARDAADLPAPLTTSNSSRAAMDVPHSAVTTNLALEDVRVEITPPPPNCKARPIF
jgi:hypothetical protein